MFDGFGGAAARSDSALGRKQPSMQICKGWHGVLFAQSEPLCRGRARRLLFDGVQLRNSAQRLLGHRATACSVHVKELAPDVGQARELGRARCKQRFIADVIVDHQMPPPALQEGAGVRTGSAALVVEHDHRRSVIEPLER